MTSVSNERLSEILNAIHESPEPDGVTTFSLLLAPIVLYVRVEHDFTVYYNVVGYPVKNDRIINVYAIKETVGAVQDMLKSPWD